MFGFNNSILLLHPFPKSLSMEKGVLAYSATRRSSLYSILGNSDIRQLMGT